MQLRKRTVRRGRQNFSPDHARDYTHLDREECITDRVRLEIPRAFWFNPHRRGATGNYWLKAGGRTYFTPWNPLTWLRPQHRATMLGFRPAERMHYFEAVCYTNTPGIDYREDDDHQILPFGCREAGGFAELDITSHADQVDYVLTTEASMIRQLHPLPNRLSWSRTISPWNGGRDPAHRTGEIYTGMERLVCPPPPTARGK